MSKELIVSAKKDEVKIAVLEEGSLLEIHNESFSKKFSVGDVYLGKVKKTASSLNAAFLNVGYAKDAFLHYHDLGPQLKSLLKFLALSKNKKYNDSNSSLESFRLERDIPKNGQISKVLERGDKVLVQIAKEPISTKGPRVTSEISLAGRFLVVVPFSNKVSLSQKIKSKEERERLRTFIEGVKPKNFGVIIRTVAQGQNVESLHQDLNDLTARWEKLVKVCSEKKPPSLVLGEVNRASSFLRDSFNGDFTKIVCDSQDLTDEITDYLNTIAPEKSKIVKHYEGAKPLFEQYGVERQIKQLFGRTVNISRGVYLVIEHTEALHVIDVNSGNVKRIKEGKSQEESAFEVNRLAATEVARQLRLRDMGGIIVVDFIDMDNAEHRKELYHHLREEMSGDKARHKILPPSRFGLIQITRQRVRPEIEYQTTEEDPNEGNRVEAPILMVDKLEEELEAFFSSEKKIEGKLCLHIHPFVASYLKRGILSIQMKWFMKHKRWVKIIERDAYKYLQYTFKDSKGNKIS